MSSGSPPPDTQARWISLRVCKKKQKTTFKWKLKKLFEFTLEFRVKNIFFDNSDLTQEKKFISFCYSVICVPH